MRIKKKHVLLEATLLDRSDEFTPHEKKVLKILHRKYGDDVYGSNFSVWDTAAWLIEELGMTYEQAYSISHTYYWNHRKLFRETEPLRKHIGIPFLFFHNLESFILKYVESLGNDDIFGVEVPIKFNGDNIFPERQVRVWTGYKGFNLYIPFRWDGYLPWSQVDERLFMCRIKLYALTKNDEIVDSYINSDDWETLINDKEFRVVVFYEIGKEGNRNEGELMSFNVPYPSTLKYDTSSEIMGNIINDVVEKISKTTFDLPSGTRPLNVDNPLD